MTSLKKLGPFYTRDQWVWDRLVTVPGEGNQPDQMSFVMGYLGQRGVEFTGFADGPIRAGAMGDLRRKMVDRRRRQIAAGVAALENFEISGWEDFDGGDASDSPNADISVQFIESHSGADAGQITHAEIFDCDAAVTRRVFADDSGQWPPDELLNRIEDAAMEVAAELHDLEIDESNTRMAPRSVKELLHPIVVESLDEANVGPSEEAVAGTGDRDEDFAMRVAAQQSAAREDAAMTASPEETDRVVEETIGKVLSLAEQFYDAVGNRETADALLEMVEVDEDFVRHFIHMRQHMDTWDPDAAELMDVAMRPYFEGERGHLSGYAVVLMKAVLELFATEDLAKAWIAKLDKALSAHESSVDANLTTMADDKGAMPPRSPIRAIDP